MCWKKEKEFDFQRKTFKIVEDIIKKYIYIKIPKIKIELNTNTCNHKTIISEFLLNCNSI